ncbi:MAG TPA: glycosyltransferase family 87 protein [Candidatus Dormibacteraeota bacterium]|nr:glycosyltransferase family 87 protein [Candidatus Dormibacteraeota bacterium]
MTRIVPADLTPRDAHAYWAVNPSDPYRGAQLGAEDAFLYAPAVAQLLAPFTELPFDVFRVGYAFLELGALVVSGLAYTLVIPGVVEDVVRGNVHILLALAIVAGFRLPAAWAAVLLTKVTPGIGLVWFAVRREWRALAQVAVVTAAIIGVSMLVGGITPWADWLRVLGSNAGSDRTFTYLGVAPPPLLVRLPLALAVVAWGAWSNRRWTVPIAALLALPVIWPSGFALLAAVPPLWLADRRSDETADRSKG